MHFANILFTFVALSAMIESRDCTDGKDLVGIDQNQTGKIYSLVFIFSVCVFMYIYGDERIKNTFLNFRNFVLAVERVKLDFVFFLRKRENLRHINHAAV